MGRLFVALAFVLLSALGIWQLQRREWKEDLLAHIHAQQTAPPLDLNALPENQPFPDLDYRHVRLTGRFLPDHEFHLVARPHEGQPGCQLVALFHQTNGGVWLINRGWVPDDHCTATATTPPPATETTLTGIARLPRPPGHFTPPNDPARNQWFSYAPVPMASAAGLSAMPMPVLIEADPTPGEIPLGGVTRLEIPNNHLQYALTWFTLAGLVLLFSVLRSRAGNGKIAPK